MIAGLQAIFSLVRQVVMLVINPATYVAGLFAWAWLDARSFAASAHSVLASVYAAIPNITYPAIFAQANRIFPVEEVTAGFLTLLALRVFVTGARWAKSWIPTVN